MHFALASSQDETLKCEIARRAFSQDESPDCCEMSQVWSQNRRNAQWMSVYGRQESI